MIHRRNFDNYNSSHLKCLKVGKQSDDKGLKILLEIMDSRSI